jgi:CheY-like chemotaxis protein
VAELKPILLVDDSDQDVELTIVALHEEGKIANSIDVAYDGEEALDYLFCRGSFAERPDIKPAVILLDLKMPKVDGFEVLETIKNDQHLSSIPVVILTSSKEDQDIAKSYASGANTFVVKPVDSDQFLNAIKQIGLFWGVVNVLSRD